MSNIKDIRVQLSKKQVEMISSMVETLNMKNVTLDYNVLSKQVHVVVDITNDSKESFSASEE
jgi:pantothenate kinase